MGLTGAIKALALAALLLLGSASPASAGGAWVLWWAEGAGSPGSHLDWETQSAYTRMEDCKKNLGAMVVGDTGGKFKGGRRSYRCWPDTVDPRGPKVTH